MNNITEIDKLFVKAEVIFALELAMKQIEYLQRVMRRQSAGGPCTVVILKHTLKLVEENM
jgi:hypothetical protein